jgi:hypothetical protein
MPASIASLAAQRDGHPPREWIFGLAFDGPQFSSGDDGRLDSVELLPGVKSAVRIENRVEQVT